MENAYNIAIAIVIFVIILIIIEYNSVKVYRFYKPWCPACQRSSEEWNCFKKRTMFRMIKCIDVNLDKPANRNLANNFGVKTVPHVAAVWPNGVMKKYEGDRTAKSYMQWLGY